MSGDIGQTQSQEADTESVDTLPAQAEDSDPLSLVDSETRVRKLDFTFIGESELSKASLKEQIAIRAPGFSLRNVIPLFGSTPPVYFDPFELQKDRLRIEHFYERNGFPRATARYQVDFDQEKNTVGIEFFIVQGPPMLIETVSFAGPGLGEMTEQLPEELHNGWRTFASSMQRREGVRFEQTSLEALQNQTLNWFRERGYAFANASAENYPDSTGLKTDIRVKVLSGPRARYGDIAVEGAESISPRVVTRELPFSAGDWFKASHLKEGQQNIFGLNLFSLALVERTPDQPVDSTVSIQVRVRETNPRRFSAFSGYYTRGGLTGRLELSHENVFGGARTLTATLEARTGLLGTESVPTLDTTRAREIPISDYQASLTFRQPYVFDRRLSAAISPLFRRRDDEIERSDQISLTGSLIYERTAMQTATLSASIRGRTFFPDRQQTLSILNAQEFSALDSLKTTTTSLSLSATLGFVDDALNPRQGFILRPSVQTTGLLPMSDLHYLRGSLTAIGLWPLGDRSGISLRLTGGGINPFRGTDVTDLVDYTLLRDQLFYAGGTSDVRGWGQGELGPKIFNLVLTRRRDANNQLVVSDTLALGYLPLGGTSKLSGSLQLDIPLPFSSKMGASVFLDAGRVFGVSDAYYDLIFGDEGLGNEENDTDLLRRTLIEPTEWRFGTGAGLLYETPVGFVSFALGFKLNPSFLDTRRPEDIVDFFFEPTDPPDIEQHFLRRFQLHFSIGRTF